MEKAILLLHLFLVIFLIALVLLQLSEGGALGMGGGGGGVVSGRSAGTALQKATWYLAAAFLATSLTLTVIAQSDRQGGSVLEGLTPGAAEGGGTTENDASAILDALGQIGDDDGLTPPSSGNDVPATGDDGITPPPE